MTRIANSKATLAALLLALLGPSNQAEGQDQAPPNIVVFLADDLGWGDLACYGNPVMKTPNLDRFASQGVRFTQCYAACGVCSPSRSAILTGRTPYRNGVFRWISEGHEVHLRTSEVTSAELLKGRGYQTCHVGKWHLNGLFNSPEQPQPDAHGFDHWLATQNNADPSHKDPTNFVRNGDPVGPMEGFSAPLVVGEAIDWLRDARDGDAPFYLQVWTHEPHLPIESDPRFMAPYEEYTDQPGVLQHHGNVSQLDHAFGLLMEELDRQGLSDSTLVLFTSDNGPEGTGEGDPDDPGSQRDRTRGSTGGLRGRKRDDFEGGIRVPGIARWPGRIEPGTVSDVPVIGSDIFATVCEVADVPLPDDRTIDGASMVPAFSGEPIERSVPMYWRTHISSPDSRVAMREGDWKVVGNVDLTEFLLFNLADDPEETTDLSDRHPDRSREMAERLVRLNASVLGDGPDWWKKEASR
ncbi:sulfatase-like hydrolase/transferase [Tautonia plasticadhaerens]|uniref:Arylsulfatase n=1 Tax=Tautonia plasticadhaerens TaxID=2527974 RepID=A0A518HAU8_9BACT|nr:sulfatase-like hydrolase/transferase [Tautonia plasticadhaerens]QDV37985.1 Arylsulfatase [Tautonia plasticadhaerens]